MSSRIPLANRSNRQSPPPSPARVVKKSRTVAVDEKRVGVTLSVAVAHLIDGDTDKAVKLGKELLVQTGRDNVIDQALDLLALDNGLDIKHFRFWRTNKECLELLRDPNFAKKVYHFQFKCGVPAGTVKSYPEKEFAVDMRRDELPDGMFEAGREECLTGIATSVLEDALDPEQDIVYFFSNVRNECMRGPDNKCLDPSCEEGTLNSQALNLVGLVFKIFEQECHYLCVGGQSHMKPVTDNLNEECFTSCQSVYHWSYLTSLNGGYLGPAEVHTEMVTTVLKEAFCKAGLKSVFDRIERDSRASFVVDTQGLTGQALSEATERIHQQARLRAREAVAILFGCSIPENDRHWARVYIVTYTLEAVLRCFSWFKNQLHANVQEMVDSGRKRDLRDPEVPFVFRTGSITRFLLRDDCSGEYDSVYGCRGYFIVSELRAMEASPLTSASDKAKITAALEPVDSPSLSYRGITKMKCKKPFLARTNTAKGKRSMGFYVLQADAGRAYDLMARKLELSGMNVEIPGRHTGFNFKTDDPEQEWKLRRAAEIRKRAADPDFDEELLETWQEMKDIFNERLAKVKK